MPQPIRGLNVGQGSGAGRGPLSGVSYFSAGQRDPSLEAGAPDLLTEGSPSGVVRPVPEESGPASGGGQYQVPGPGRDLTKDPLSKNEQYALGAVQQGLERFGGPIGTLMSGAIDYNRGQYAAGVPGMSAPTSIGGQLGLNKALGMGTFDATRAAVEGAARTGWTKLTGGYDENYGNEGRRTPMAPAGAGYELTPDDVIVGGPMPLYDGVQGTDLGPVDLGSRDGGGGREATPGNFGLGWGGRSDSGGFGSDASAADGGLATDDGFVRPVGLSGPRYADGGMVDSPQTLNQMGFADGGQIGLGVQRGTDNPQMMQMRVMEMARDPRVQQAAQRIVGAAMQSGELTPEELTTLGRVAEAAMHNPQLYPQLRNFVAQNGMAPLPPAYDPRVVMTLMVASKIMGQTQPGQVPPTDVAQMQNPNGTTNGGFLQGPGTGRSDSIGTVNQSTGQPVKVANGEYVIPKHVVDAKGKEFFDKMLRQYAPLTPSEG